MHLTAPHLSSLTIPHNPSIAIPHHPSPSLIPQFSVFLATLYPFCPTITLSQIYVLTYAFLQSRFMEVIFFTVHDEKSKSIEMKMQDNTFKVLYL